MKIFYFIILITLYSNFIHASDWHFSGNLKLLTSEYLYSAKDVATIDNHRLQPNHILSSRLMSSYQKKNFTFNLHYDLKAQYSKLNNPGFNTESESRQIFDFQQNYHKNNDMIYSHRIDRLEMSYIQESWIIKIGRQAISWGNGFLFNPLDLINPYSQTAIDKEYKTGDDMLYTQLLTDNGDDWQWVFVPRRNLTTGDLSAEESSLLIKYKTIKQAIDLDLLAARHYDESIVGFGLLKAVKESIWRLDASLTLLQDDSMAVMLVTNMDYSWVLMKKNMYGYLEYAYNSLGINSYQELDGSSIKNRLERSEVFTTGRHYLAAGLTIETSPLTNISSNLIFNLHDQSMLIPVSLTYSWKQNVNLILGGTFSLGEKNTEFGGYKSALGYYLSPGQNIYGQIFFYF